MQRLFPCEGESQPRWRFPLFRDAAAWSENLLGEVFETTSGGTPNRSIAGLWNGDIPWVTTSLVNFDVITQAEEFISEEGLSKSSAKLLPKGTVLIAMYGQGKTRGQVALLGVEAATNQACAAVLPKTGIDPYFVFLSFTSRYGEFKLRADQQTVWLTQLEMAELFDATKQNISLHLKNVFQDGELDPAAVVKESLTSTAEAGFCRVGCGWGHRMPVPRRARGQRYCIQREAGA
jgi:Type I restriction modification DNA specificity domain